jgi:hypothetical protein
MAAVIAAGLHGAAAYPWRHHRARGASRDSTDSSMSIPGFSFPTAIRFGPGARREVAQHLREQGLTRPLIVTDQALAALPLLAEFKSHLAGLDVAVFSGVHGNPTANQVMAGGAAF